MSIGFATGAFHVMDKASTPYRVHQCSKCPGDKEFYCESCPCDLCTQCKENHLTNLKTMDHNVVIYRWRSTSIPKQKVSLSHTHHCNAEYCRFCQSSRFSHFSKQKPRTIIYVRNEAELQNQRKIIHTIRSETFFNRPIFLTGIKADMKTCHKNFSFYQSEMLTKARKLNDRVFNVLRDVDLKHRCLKQKRQLIRHLNSILEYEYLFEQSSNLPVRFLIKKTCLPQIRDSPSLTLHTSRLSMNESLNKKDVIKSLSGIQITERGNRRVGNQCLLKLMSVPEIHQSLTVKDVHNCVHISWVATDQVWVSDYESDLILTNLTGKTLHQLKVLSTDSFSGLHTVNSECEIIYIDRKYKIKKLSNDMKTHNTIIASANFTWIPQCVYWSPNTGDLLVGMYDFDTKAGKVTRYNQSGQPIQTIQYDSNGLALYSQPNYITENNNGDIVVSNSINVSGAVVAIESGGRHRFSYSGHPSGSRLLPYGICTDALSHILVCDDITNTVQMLDRDGKFLSYLLIRPPGVFEPHCLSYDAYTHRLWVGSNDKNKIYVYRYITRNDTLTDEKPETASLREIHSTKTENQQEENGCQLKLKLPPELLQTFNVTGIDRCLHISCGTSDRLWVSGRENNLILTNITGVDLFNLKDLHSGYIGPHTMSRKDELIYIDKNYRVIKLSKDIKTTTTFVETTDSAWEPHCVYCSPSTGDLLVGMINKDTRTGKVTRYNQNGQATQTIQHDNKGLAVYRSPTYITENNNGDIVVSDCILSGAVVVTDRKGIYRFSYTGHPSGSELSPGGICTDTLSHILVCDDIKNTVQMLNSDGQFLSNLLAKSQEMGEPYSLSYDNKTNCLLVGSEINTTVCVYRYITRQDAMTNEDSHSSDEDALPITGST